MPQNTIGIKYSYSDTGVSVNFEYSYLTTEIKPTETVLNYIKGKERALVRNACDGIIYNKNNDKVYSENIARTHELNRFTPRASSSKEIGSVINNNYNSRYYVPITITTRVSRSYNTKTTYDDAVKSGYVPEQRISTFYDLLPAGTYVDLDSIKVTSYYIKHTNMHREDFITRTEVIENWKNTGRTLLVVHAQVPKDYKNYFFWKSNLYNGLDSGMVLDFNLYNSWINVADNGESLKNFAAYESQNGPLPGGYPDNGGSNIIPSHLKNAFTDLNRDGNQGDVPNSFLYSEDSISYEPLTTTEVGFSKQTSSPENEILSAHSIVPAGGEYSYRIRYEAFPSATAKNMVFYDVLEGAYGEEPHWQGILTGVDVSQVKSRGVDVKTYYTLQDITNSAIFGDMNHLDNNPNIWQNWDTNPPADASKVRALAFDLRKDTQGNDFTLKEGNSVYVEINMRAPISPKEEIENHIKNKDLAYNRALCVNIKNASYEGGSNAELGIDQSVLTTVELKDSGLIFDKSSSPASGTEDQPAKVYGGDTIEYRINLSNDNIAQSIKDIVLEDVVPEGLSVNAEDIKVMLDENETTIQPIKSSTRASIVSNDGNSFKFKIISIAGKEKITIIIPAKVDKMVENKNVDFVNSAVITKVYGQEYHLESNKTYHKQEYTEYTPQIGKTLIGRDMADNEFTFSLKDAEKNIIETKSNTAAEAGQKDSISFKKLYFDRPGEYNYTISEDKSSLDSIIYDKNVYEIHINVTANEDKSLALGVQIINNGTETKTMDFINEYKTRSFTAKKIWEVPDNVKYLKDAKHPNVKLQLYRDGVKYGEPVEITPSEPDKFITQESTYTWDNLPIYRVNSATGTQSEGMLESVYTVKEIDVPYSYFMLIEDEGATVRNVYWPNTRTIRKIWDVGLPKEGTVVTMTINQEVLTDMSRDSKIADIEYSTITLDGIAEEYPNPFPQDPLKIKGEFSPWVYTIVLPVSGMYNGQPVHYFYTITEHEMDSSDYKLGDITIIPAGGANVTNVRQTTEFTVNKSWINGPEIKPDVTIWLLQDGVRYRSAIIQNGKTSCTFTNLPRFKEWEPATEENGFKASYTKYKYTVEEVAPQNYRSTITEVTNETDVVGADIVNKYVPPVEDIKAYKIWKGGPEEDHVAVPLTLMRSIKDGEPEEIDAPYTVSPEKEGEQSYTYTWKGLPLTDDKGEKYTYNIIEQNAIDDNVVVNENKYIATVDGLTVTNTYLPPRGSVCAYKNWIGGKQEDYIPIKVKLSRSIEGGELEEVSAPYNINTEKAECEQYIYTWDDLPLNDENGNSYTYSFSETDSVDGIFVRNGRKYKSVVSDNIINNLYEPDLIKLSAKKIWSGGPEEDHIAVELAVSRYTSIDPENKEAVYTEDFSVEKNSDGSFSYRWDNLPKTDDKGEPYIYDIEEVSNKNGLMLQNGNTYRIIKKQLEESMFEFTNSYITPEPSTITLNIAKRISGDNYAINAKDYSFKLSGDVPETVKYCDENGQAAFELAFNKVGEYKFALAENKGNIEGMVFDSSVYTIKVNVSFNEAENRFENKVNILKDGKEYTESDIVFTNNYTKPEKPPVVPSYPKINVPIEAEKVFRNGTLKANQFTFVLKDSQGREIAKASNDANGKISFPERTFSRAVNNYKYTVEEIAGKDKNIVYDKTVYTVKISTTPVDGKLHARVDLEKDGVPYDGKIVFVNTNSVPKTGDGTPEKIAIFASGGLITLALYIVIKRKYLTAK